MAAAQTSRLLDIDASSFKPINTDAITGVAIDKIGRDLSQRPCARIKMHVNRMSADEIRGLVVIPIGGNVAVTRQTPSVEGTGLIIELTAKQPTRFYLHHDKYGDSNEVSLNLEGDREYRLNAQLNFLHSIVVASNTVDAEVYIDGEFKGRIEKNYMLSVNDVTPGSHKLKLQQGALVRESEIVVSSANISFRVNLNHEAARPQYVIFELEPKWANVSVDGKNHVPDQYGLLTLVLSNGSYNYTVSANDYYSQSGSFEVKGAKIEKQIKLKPAFGWLVVPDSGDLKDANVFVDDTHIGTTPLKSKGLKSGVHKVRIQKSLFKVLETTVTIKDDETFTFVPKLEPDFATVTINAGEGCSIYVNNEFKGKKSWSGKLATGSYLFESRKENHRSTSVTKSIVPSVASHIYNLAEPTPILGTLNVMTTPAMADVYVDGVIFGRTPLMQDVIIGDHKVKVCKEGFYDFEQSIKVEDGKMVEVIATMEKDNSVVETVNGVTIKMIYVEGGTFSMGSTNGDSDERPVHSVTLDSYYMAETEVTQAQWRAVMGSNPSSYTGDNRPVECVSWHDAMEFCKKLSELTGKKYTLPTEAQWEYAARGGNKSKGYTYSGSNNIYDVAKYDSSGGHNNVKSKQPNELGLYDMSGNVWEWCLDWYGDYSSSSQTNPTGPESGSSRVLRGGGWGLYASYCRVASWQ